MDIAFPVACIAHLDVRVDLNISNVDGYNDVTQTFRQIFLS